MERRSFLVSKDVVVPLASQAPVVLGRDPTACSFVLSDERVSRVHAMVLFRDQAFHLKDLNSSNGTFLNGKRVTGMTLLKAGDRIGIAPFSLEFVQPEITSDGGTSSTSDVHNKLEGSLATLPVTDLIQLLNSTGQNGVLTITDDQGRKGSLGFADGEIVQAQYNGVTGEQAVFNLLAARSGRFEFARSDRSHPVRVRPQQISDTAQHTAEESPDRQIGRRTQSLLLEGARLLDEHRAQPPVVPSTTATSPAR